MAYSRFLTTQHSSSQFVESAGAVLFRLSTQDICLLHLLPRDEYVLAKGRCNHGESRQQTALREVREETNYPCRILPVTMASRAPPAVEMGPSPDVARVYEDSTEPFSLQIRQLDTEGNVKLIWWFIAAVEENEIAKEERPGEERFEVKWHAYEDAVSILTFQGDRDLVSQAIRMVRATYGQANASSGKEGK